MLPEESGLSLKEQRAEKRKAERIRKSLIQFTIASVFLATVIGLTLGLFSGPAVGVGAGLSILALTLSFKYPRQALYAFIIYLPFGGTVTYAIGGDNPLLQLAKDAFYIPALIGVLQFCYREKLPIFMPKTIVAPLGILVTLACMTLIFVNGAQQLSASGEQPIAMGILGLKVFLGYLPLITCAYYLIRNKQDLYSLLRIQIILIIVCCGLAFIQYLMLRSGVCEGTRGAVGDDLFKASLKAKCFVGGSLLYSPEHGQIRLPGTFVAP
ncbi:MAG: hypothetical protein F6K19_51010, partial [Cyanothece sp. SIO1E1]|nr:hypothetical protein [Cyanothece sp. SIO1E1]